MSGVYGDMLLAFPELMRATQCWSKPDKSDVHTVTVIDLPKGYDRLYRAKFTGKGNAVDYKDADLLFVTASELHKIDVGYWFYDLDQPEVIHRIVGKQDYAHVGGYICFLTERVTGATVDQQQKLEVKEAYFA